MGTVLLASKAVTEYISLRQEKAGYLLAAIRIFPVNRIRLSCIYLKNIRERGCACGESSPVDSLSGKKMQAQAIGGREGPGWLP